MISTTFSMQRKRPGKECDELSLMIILGEMGLGGWIFSLSPQFFGIVGILKNN